MEDTYQYAWIIPFLPLPVPISIGIGLLLAPRATKKMRRVWSFLSIFLLTIVMLVSADLSIQQIKGHSIYQYVWSWTINNSFSFEFGNFIDPLTSIMSILITTVGILVLLYSDNYMYHDQGYLRFFAYMNFFNTSMLGLVTSSNLIQIYIFWELVGMCSYLLIGFWFTRPIAANACQKAFVINRIGDFGLLLGILGLYWITGSFEFRDLFKIVNNLIDNNEVNSLLLTLCTILLFLGAIAKSAQFPLHVWLPDAMEGPTPISALIHAATMVAAGIFLVARLLPLFTVIPYILNIISLIGILTILLGATLAIAQIDIKRGLAYSTMSQLGYIMLALGMGSYRAALFHLITHAYSKALLFLGSGSIIHSMESVVGYSPIKNQNIALMGGLKKYVPITKTSFFLGTLSLCAIPPLACFWSKEEILTDSWLYSPIFGIIACATTGLTAFYMFRIYLLTFEGHLNVYSQNLSAPSKSSYYLISIWGKNGRKVFNKDLLLSIINDNNTEEASFFSKKRYPQNMGLKKKIIPFIKMTHFGYKHIPLSPHESDNTMLLPILLLSLFTLCVGYMGISFDQGGMEFTFLSKWITPSINLLHTNSENSLDWYDFITNAIVSISISYVGILVASFLYRPVYLFLQNLNLINSFVKIGPKRTFWDKFINVTYNWSYNRGYIDRLYVATYYRGMLRFASLTNFFDRRIIDGITNGVGLFLFFMAEGIKNVGGGRISSYLFFYFSYVFIFFVIYYLINF